MADKTRVQELLYRALAAPIGLLLRVSDPTRARQFLYQTRTAIGDPDLGRLQFRVVDLGEGPMVAVVKSAQLPGPSAHQSLALPGASSPNLGDLDL